MKRVPLIELVTPADEDEAAVRGAAILTRGDVLHLRLPASEMSRRDRMARAEAALNEVVRVLKARHGLPSAAYVELDEESFGTPVAPFHKGRFLLPHQDGGHSSFLTPSRLDRPELSADERVFSRSVYWKRPSHKMFQGFMVTSTGQPPGITHYYNLLAPVWDAFVRARGAEPADIPELASFVLQNLRWSREQQHVHGSRYFTLGALLGSRELAHHVMPSGPRAESELWPEQYANVPALCAMADTCACGLCRGPGERLMCHACAATLGCTWAEFRTRYDASVVGEQWDVLVGNNLMQLHAADSSAERTIRPMCIVLDSPDTDEYERWLAGQWRTCLGLAEAALSEVGAA